ncbi:unnamed protein product [Prunus armeniaca]
MSFGQDLKNKTKAAPSAASQQRKGGCCVAKAFIQTGGGHLQGRAEGQTPATSKLFSTRGGAAAPPYASVDPPVPATKACSGNKWSPADWAGPPGRLARLGALVLDDVSALQCRP